jgi:hypothetical protein
MTTITPFLALRLRGKKDALLARQRARRIASLLHFDAHEQACIAAGAFVIACQALAQFGKPRLCFQIENHQLQIFAAEAKVQLTPKTGPIPARMTGLFPSVEAKALYRMVKPLPSGEAVDENDLGWLVTSIEGTARGSAFEEIVKQNQEILALLHELGLYRQPAQEKSEKSPAPHAA